MTAISVERIAPLAYNAMQVTEQYVADIFGLIQAAKEQNLWDGEAAPIHTPAGVGWRVVIRYADGRPDLVAYPGYWIVATQDLAVEIYDGPTGALKYRADVPFDWQAETAAPAAVLNEDNTVTVTVRQPRSINGPWSYTVNREAVVNHSVFQAPVVGEPVTTPVLGSSESDNVIGVAQNIVMGADVAITVEPELATDVAYVFTVTATDSYGKTTTSLPSDSVTSHQ